MPSITDTSSGIFNPLSADIKLLGNLLGVVIREQHGDAALAGMACRHGAEWRIGALQSVPVSPADSAGYRQAATSLPPLVLQAVEASMVGDALDARGEAAARDHQWRSPEASR